MQRLCGLSRAVQRRWCLSFIMLVTLTLGFVVFAHPAYADKSPKAAKAQVADTAERKKATDLVKKATSLMKAGKGVDAELVLQEALKVDPDWVEVYVTRGKCYDILHNYANAAENWQKAVEMVPDNNNYKRFLARAATSALNWPVATSTWEELAAINPRDLEAANALASIYFANGKIVDAAVWNNAALDLDPDNASTKVMKARIDIRNKHFNEATSQLQEILGTLPSDHPLIEECMNGLDEAERGKKNQLLSYAALIGFPLLIVIGAIVMYLHMNRASAPAEPVLDLEAATEDSVCRFLLQYCRYKFDMPRGFCWSMGVDGRHLVLQMSHLIGETSGVAQVTIARRALLEWLEARGTAPFMYEAELENKSFQGAFSFLIKELAGINIHVGVPVVHKGQLMALVLLGSSRSARPEKVHQHFEEFAEEVQDISEKAGMTLERIGHRNRRVVDTTTGLWNRDYYEEQISSIYRGCRTANIPMSVFMMRMDQTRALLGKKNEEERNDLLYNLAQLVYKGISGEMNVTLCHLGEGNFALIAPERDPSEAEKLAKVLKGCFEKSNLAGPDVRTTGCVAYCIAPEDGDDPVMLRSLLARTFHGLVYADGNMIRRVEKIDIQEEVEAKPQEELIIRRSRRTSDDKSSSEYQPFGRAKITSNADLGEAHEAAPNTRMNIATTNKIVSLGVVKPIDAPSKTTSDKGSIEFEKQSIAPKADVDGDNSEKLSTKSKTLSMQHKLAPEDNDSLRELFNQRQELTFGDDNSGKTGAAESIDTNYKLELEFDEDGVEVDTQCCSQEVFEELIGFELEQAQESGDVCALVYLHMQNIEEIRSTGRENYMKLRRELAALMRVFLREDIDIPGLVGEDDFAVFMTGSDRNVASSLADRLNLTTRNLDVGSYFMVPSVGVALAQSTDNCTADSLIMRAKNLAKGEGIHYEGA